MPIDSTEGLAPQEEPSSVMDLEKLVSRQSHGLPTASICVEADNAVDSVVKDRTAILKNTEM